jgi:hypothetical protein
VNRPAGDGGGIHFGDNGEWLLGVRLDGGGSEEGQKIDILHDSPGVKVE